MKALTFKKNSWHFWLAKLVGYEAPTTWTRGDGTVAHYGDKGDICTYSRHVVGALFSILVISFFGVMGTAIIGTLLAHVILGIIFSIIMGTFFFTDIGVIGLFIITIVSLVAGTMYSLSWLRDRARESDESNNPDGFIKHAYRSWKEKYCLKINFVDPVEEHDDNLRAGN